MNIHLLELEIGGSWIRFRALDPKRNFIFSLKQESLPLTKIPSYLVQFFDEKKIHNVRVLSIGARGIWTKSEKKSLAKKLKPLAEKVVVLSDVEFTYKKIFGKRAGILLIAGTGSIAYGKNKEGKIARAGGAGPQKGDEGSAYWISKKWLGQRRIKKMSIREIAGFAPEIIRRASKRDKKAIEILKSAWKELVKLVQKVYRELKFQGVVPLALSGGLFQNRNFKKEFIKELKLSLGDRCRVLNWQ